MMTKKEADFYKKLKNELIDTTVFPTDYMYKFIIPNKTKLKAQVENIFNFEGVVIKSKTSKSDKFVSLTILVKIESADDIIKKYKEAAQIEGIISL